MQERSYSWLCAIMCMWNTYGSSYDQLIILFNALFYNLTNIAFTKRVGIDEEYWTSWRDFGRGTKLRALLVHCARLPSLFLSLPPPLPSSFCSISTTLPGIIKTRPSDMAELYVEKNVPSIWYAANVYYRDFSIDYLIQIWMEYCT